MKIAYVGNFTQRHCTEVHIALTLEDLGHEVTKIQEDPANAETFRDQISGHDLFLFTRTWNNLVTLDDLVWMRERGIPSASYHLDLYVGLQRQDGLDDDPFWRTDFVFSPDGDPVSQAVFESKGINHHYIKPGVYKKDCYLAAPGENDGLGNDVIFVGGGLEYGHPEWPYRRQLVQWLYDTYGGRFSKYGHPQPTVRNEALNQLYSNSKVVIGDSVCLNFNHPYYWSDRVYETLGRGGFIIHPFIEGMQEEFIDGENIVFYRYNDMSETHPQGLKALIDYYIDHPEERKSIMMNGHNYVKLHSTYNNRLAQMLDIINFGTVQPYKDGDILKALGTEKEECALHPGDHINLGAGHDIQKNFINVDHLTLPGIDKVHNLMEFPWPFSDESAGYIKAVDVIEHLASHTKNGEPTYVRFVEEAHRILKRGGVLFIQTPGYDADFLWIDPTHVRGFAPESFDFFDSNKPFGKSTGFYSDAKFDVTCEVLDNKNLQFTMVKQ